MVLSLWWVCYILFSSTKSALPRRKEINVPFFRSYFSFQSSELLKITEPGARHASFVGSIVASKLCVTMESQQEPSTLTTSEDCQNYNSQCRLNLRKVFTFEKTTAVKK